MSKRVLAFGVVLSVLVLALMAVLALLDVITTDQLMESLPRLLGVVVVATVALLLVVRLGRLTRKD